MTIAKNLNKPLDEVLIRIYKILENDCFKDYKKISLITYRSICNIINNTHYMIDEKQPNYEEEKFMDIFLSSEYFPIQ